MKKTIAFALAGLLVSTAHAAHNPPEKNLQDQYHVNKRHHKTPTVIKNTKLDPLTRYHIPSVMLAPYIGVRSSFHGRELVINNPSINEDVKLLQMRARSDSYYRENNLNYPFYPRIIFSGALEGEADYQQQYTGPHSSDINLGRAELDTFIEGFDWVNGFFTVNFENTTGTVSDIRRINNSRFYMDKGFIILGNLDRYPFYASWGQMYVPFGKHSSNMISSTLSKKLGRIKGRAIVMGYHETTTNHFYAAAFTFRGDSAKGAANLTQINTFGLNGGYEYDTHGINGVLGGSYISNMTDSKGIQGSGSSSANFTGLSQNSTYENINRSIPALDVYGSIGYGPCNLLGEYVTALKRFNVQDITYYSHGARVQAGNIEGSYGFNLFGLPSSVALGYGFTVESLAFGLPQKQYAITYNIYPFKHVLISMEYAHQSGYGKGATANGPTRNGTTATVDTSMNGRVNNTLTLQFNLYF